MEQTALAIVEDTPDVLQARLKREWESIEVRKEQGDLDYGICRARALQTYHDLGLTHRQIVVCIGINRGWIDQLLRYGRFINFAHAAACADICRMPEQRFRKYWRATSDAKVMAKFRGNGRTQDNAPRMEYEQHIFHLILEKYMDRKEGLSTPSKNTKQTRQYAKRILEQFANGKFHFAQLIADTIELDLAMVRSICDRIVTHGSYQTFGERRPASPAQGSFAYRFVKGGKKKLDVIVLQSELKPVLDDMANVINGHHVHFSQHAMQLSFAELLKALDRVAR